MPNHRARTLALLLLLTPALPAPAAEWALPGPSAGLAAQSLAAFATAVAGGSGGALVLRPAPADDAQHTLAALEAGRTPIGMVPMAVLEAAHPVLAMDRVPYLCTNFVDAQKLWRVLRPRVVNALESRGLVLLYALVSTPPAPLAGRPLASLAQWRGARLLVSRPMLGHLARALGAEAVDGASQRDALLGRRVDVAFQDPDSAVAERAWEYASDYLDAPAWFPKHLVAVRRDAVDALAAGPRAALVAAARDAEADGWRAARRASEDAVQALRDRGVKTAEPPVGLLIQLETIGRELLFLWSDGAGEEGARLVEDYYAVR